MIRSILLFLVCCSSAHGAPPCPAIRKSGGARAPPCPMVSAPLYVNGDSFFAIIIWYRLTGKGKGKEKEKVKGMEKGKGKGKENGKKEREREGGRKIP